MEKEPDFVFKLAIVGDYAVGKTSLIGRYIHKKFIKEYKPTLGVNLILKEIVVKNKLGKDVTCNLIFWDIAGQEKYEKVRQLYYKGCSAAVLVYDCTRYDSYENVKTKWVKDYSENSTTDPLYIVISNKNDLTDIKKVDHDAGNDLVKEIDALHFVETSAKTGENVDEAFNTLVRLLLKKSGEQM